MRELVSQTKLTASDLIMPYFVVTGRDKKEAIESMPQVKRLSIDNLIGDIKEARNLGIKAILLFGIPAKKDALGLEAYESNGIVQKAIKEVRKNIEDIVIITDVCLCGYTAHGHCGILKSQKSPDKVGIPINREKVKSQNEIVIDKDKTLEILGKIALSHAEAGADLVAPSAMMDGQVKAIRESLDKSGFIDVGILAYSAKYASSFYGPFRQALGSQPQFGDRKGYQLDIRNSDEALREIEQDINEGADIVMVKPALAYLDIIQRAKQRFNIPLAAYNVSGEYALVKGYCQRAETERNLVLEILTAIKRAGADLIITYHAKEAAKWLKH